MTTKEDIKDFLDVNSNDDIINYIFRLNSDLNRYKNAVDTMKEMLNNRVTKERYNKLVEKYNKLINDSNLLK